MSSAARTASGSVPKAASSRLYFSQGDAFDLDHWQVPEAFDWGKWDVDSKSADAVRFRRRMTLVNYSGTPLDVDVDRNVRLLRPADFATHLGTQLWTGRSHGGIRIVQHDHERRARAVAAQFGARVRLDSRDVHAVSQDDNHDSLRARRGIDAGPRRQRRVLRQSAVRSPARDKDRSIFFRGDGQYRSKIGLSPSRARSVAGSYDDERHVLTLVQYTRPPDASEYVNSMWEMQREPFKGDVINSYNDGPPAPGNRLLARFTSSKRHRRRSASHPTSSTPTSIAPFI